jgi:hypothetical protein
MGLLKLTPKVPASQKPTPAPRAVKKPDKPKGVRTLVGLSAIEIEEAIEKEYIDRGAILFRFEPTTIKDFKLSCDGRFGLRHNKKLCFFQLFHFVEKQKIEDFRISGLVYESLKWKESTQIHFYYNEKVTTADMQIHAIIEYIAKALGSELRAIIEKKRREYFDIEDDILETEIEAANIREDLDVFTDTDEAEIGEEDSVKFEVSQLTDSKLGMDISAQRQQLELVNEEEEPFRLKLNISF